MDLTYIAGAIGAIVFMYFVGIFHTTIPRSERSKSQAKVVKKGEWVDTPDDAGRMVPVYHGNTYGFGVEGVSTQGCLMDQGFVLSLQKNVKTLYDVVHHTDKCDNKEALGVISTPHTFADPDSKPVPKILSIAGKWTYMTYGQLKEQATLVGTYMVEHGLNKHDRVAIWAGNCPQWSIAEQACNCYGFTTVSVYDTLGPDAAAYIVADSGARAVVCEPTNVASMAQLFADPVYKQAHGHAEIVLVTGDITEEQRKACMKAGARLVATFPEMLQAGIKPKKHSPPAPEDLGTIMYTSGTTGNPKGVKLSHKNLVATMSSALLVPGFQVKGDDVHLSYLPLAHIFERTIHVGMMMFGAKIAFASQGSKQLLNDLTVIRPTVFAGVPKVYVRVRDAAKAKSTGIKKVLLEKALADKEADIQTGCGYLRLWDKIIFSKVKEKLGGRVRFMITGGAKISKDTLMFLRSALGPVVQGYGATETSAAATLTLSEDTNLGPVGCPMPCANIKTVDVKDMNFLCGEASEYKGRKDELKIIEENKRKQGGEIWIRGSGVSSGYWDPSVDDKTRTVPSNGMAKKNAEDFLLDNGYYWFKTGDAGNIGPNGTLSIMGRTKDIFKLSIGEYIAVEKVEQALNENCPLVDMVFVPKQLKGTKGQDLGYIGCCAVVSDAAKPGVEKWAKENGVSGDINAIVKDAKFRQRVFDDFKEGAKLKKLMKFEQIQKVDRMHIEYSAAYPEGWIEPGLKVPSGTTEQLLTATQKARRVQLDMYWQEAYKGMYMDE